MITGLETRIDHELESLDLSGLTETELAEFSKQFETKYKLSLPLLDRADIHRSDASDCRIDVRNDPSRHVSDRSKPCMVDGKRIIISVPFHGDARLLLQNPKAANAISAMATVEKDTVDFEYKRPLPIDPTLLERDIQNDLNALEANLTWVKSDIDLFNRGLPATIKQKLTRRLQSIEAGKAALDGLSIPVRQRATPATSSPQAKTTREAAAKRSIEEQEYEHDVFICHASEDKDLVARPLAINLKTHGVRVWYDEFAITIGDSLRQKIDEGLVKSRYGIVIFSPDFFKKQWTQRELDGLTEKEMRNGQKVILPVWHNVSKDEVLKFSPPLADKLAGSTADMDKLINQLLEIFGKKRLPSGAHYDVPGTYFS
jgi:hypothetical protein